MIELQSVADIVYDNFNVSSVFEKLNIDYCCNGERTLSEVCEEKGLNIEEVKRSIEEAKENNAIPFAKWPSDLLIDYVLKIHHRNIRNNGPKVLSLLEKVLSVHGDKYHSLSSVHSLFVESLEDLESHLLKEENVLFPYCLELFEAQQEGVKLEPMHCGTVLNPIGVMRMEHESEGNRYALIAKLTNNYTVADDACDSYKQLMKDLKEFMTALHEHIHLENNILFPHFIELEKNVVDNVGCGSTCGGY